MKGSAQRLGTASSQQLCGLLLVADGTICELLDTALLQHLCESQHQCMHGTRSGCMGKMTCISRHAVDIQRYTDTLMTMRQACETTAIKREYAFGASSTAKFSY